MTMIDREENEYMGKPSSNNHLHAQPFWKKKLLPPMSALTGINHCNLVNNEN